MVFIRTVFKFELFFVVSVFAILLSYPLVPIAVAFCDAQGRLPRGFRWLETHDALGWIGPATEQATRNTTDRFGRKAGLIHYLWRNKAYTLRNYLRATPKQETAQKKEFGRKFPKKVGLSYWFGYVSDEGKAWFEFEPRIGFGKFYLFARIGWKMKPYFGETWPVLKSAGIFSGASPRIDDWDDFPPFE